TASVATDSTQIATTAFVKNVLENYIYPVGSIYMNMAVATNPGTLLGFGTWVAYAEGRVLVGYEASGTFDALDESLGAETHTLTVDEMPAHTHGYQKHTGTSNLSIHDISHTVTSYATTQTSSTGGGSAHSNLQPSVTVHMWKRTA
ncbi:MAG: hypothetical protein QF535_15155, partial [Anaerolineales bacterium]|nr:hypothetical protein [Anaerolineales bacterium]